MIGPSPRWLQDALIKADQRPINNVVDVTNYVMLEYGQPLHAFDFEKVKDARIVVRQARSGERLATLDGEDRKLSPPMLAIADSSDAIGLAGVIGGAGSEMMIQVHPESGALMGAADPRRDGYSVGW